MKYLVRRASKEDLPLIEEIYAYARHFMEAHGNPNQWGKHHPPVDQLVLDIERSCLYVISDGNAIHGVFYFYIGEDPTYRAIYEGTWRAHSPYGTIHRIAGDGSGGILKTAVVFALGRIDHLRIDTHRDNYVMQQALEKLGFQRRGIIFLSNGSERIAFDKI